MTTPPQPAPSRLAWLAPIVRGRFGRSFLIAAAVLTMLSWAGAAAALIAKASTATTVLAFGVAGVITEVTFWSGALYFGVSLFRKAKVRLGGRRAKTGQDEQNVN